MVDVRRVTLPGVGVLHSFEAADGGEVAVVAHRTGRSELVSRPAGARDDDDAVTVRLDEVTVADEDAIAGRPLGEVPAASGVAVVAIVRDDHAHPSPDPGFIVQPGDTVVAVGPTERIAAVFRVIHDGMGGDAEA